MKTSLGKTFRKVWGFMEKENCKISYSNIPLETSRAAVATSVYARWKWALDNEKELTPSITLCTGCLYKKSKGLFTNRTLCIFPNRNVPNLPICPVFAFCRSLSSEKDIHKHLLPTTLLRRKNTLLWQAYSHVVDEAKKAHMSIKEIPKPSED